MKNKNKPQLFLGAATALITPFCDGKIDFASLFSLIDKQISEKISAIVICGTTGEAATLSERERESLICASAERIDSRVPLIVGVGSNNTEISINYTRFASSHGADALLAVTPYYNKGTKSGVVEHYKRIANESDLPMILYNVPSRTGVDLSLSQLEVLSEVENIVAIKEASTDIEKAERIVKEFGDRYSLYSGNDSLILPYLALGGKGVISVISNILPTETNEICSLFFKGEIEKGRALQYKLLPIINMMFEETNPAPVKFAASLLGLCKNELRLPLSPIQRELSDKICGELKKFTSI